MAPFNGSGEMPRTLVIGNIGPRMEAELIAVGIPAGTVPTGTAAVGLLRAGEYDVAVVPTDLTDMSAYDFTTSLLRHVQGVFVVLWGNDMDSGQMGQLLGSDRVVHFRGETDGSVAMWLMEKASGGNPAPPGVAASPGGFAAANPATPPAALSGLAAPAPGAANPFTGASASPFGGGADDLPVLGGQPADDGRVDELEEELNLAQAELEEVRARLQQAESAAERSENEARAAKEQLESDRRERADSDAATDELKRSLLSAQEFLKTVSQERDGLKALVQSLEEERSGQESGAEGARAELEEVRTYLLNVQSELAETRRERDAARAEAHALETVVQQRDEQLKQVQEQAGTSSAGDDGLRDRVAALDWKVAAEAAAFLKITGEGEEHIERLRALAAAIGELAAAAKGSS